MNIRFFNARILTMEEGRDVFMGELWVVGNRIEYVGDKKGAGSAYDWDREYDCKGNMLMPGFKNVHTHTAMTGFRSLCDDLNLQEWLNKEIFPREAKMTYDDVYYLTKLGILEYLTSGITGIVDMYLEPDAICRATHEMGMRCVQSSGLNKFGPALEVLEERYNKFNGLYEDHGFKLGVHAEYTCDKDLLKAVSDLLHKYKAPCYTHMSETKTEVDECIGRYGMTPIALFEELGMWDYGGVIYHGVWPMANDMEIIKKRGIIVVSNPSSNAKLASGIAPLTDYLNNKITIALGTDGPSSNNALDMFREMYLAAVLGKIKTMDPTAVPAMEVLKMATVNGNKVMDMPECDILAKGKLADLILIDMRRPNMQPVHNAAVNLVYSGSKENVKLTMIDGKILYENGEFIGIDIDEIYNKTYEIMKRIG